MAIKYLIALCLALAVTLIRAEAEPEAEADAYYGYYGGHPGYYHQGYYPGQGYGYSHGSYHPYHHQPYNNYWTGRSSYPQLYAPRTVAIRPELRAPVPAPAGVAAPVGVASSVAANWPASSVGYVAVPQAQPAAIREYPAVPQPETYQPQPDVHVQQPQPADIISYENPVANDFNVVPAVPEEHHEHYDHHGDHYGSQAVETPIAVYNDEPLAVDVIAADEAPAEAAFAPHFSAVPDEEPVASQYHAQDEFGNVIYGYNNPNSAKTEQRDSYGNVVGSYSYVDGTGYPKHVSYVADPVFGFRVTSANNLPIAHQV